MLPFLGGRGTCWVLLRTPVYGRYDTTNTYLSHNGLFRYIGMEYNFTQTELYDIKCNRSLKKTVVGETNYYMANAAALRAG